MEINFVAVNQNLLEKMFLWFNSKEGWRIRQESFPINMEEFNQRIKLWQRPFGRLFGVVYNDEIIGYVAWENWDARSRRADVHMFIDWNWRQQGIGKQVAEKAMEIFFKDENMHKGRAFIPEYNKVMINFAETVGMKQEGRLIKDIRVKGKYVDIIIMSMLVQDYFYLKASSASEEKNKEERKEEVTAGKEK